MPNSPVLLGVSPAIAQLQIEAELIARSHSKVLITGESGVGKEVLAGVIHARSARSHLPLLTLNCAAMPETLLESELFGHLRGSFTDAHRDKRGVLELADGGTVLLDEVGEMSLRMQGMLLRFLEHGEIQRIGSERPAARVNVRIMAATNRDLWQQVERGEFRQDLYYRLHIVHLSIPPLRERREDIPVLMRHFLDRLGEEHQRAAGGLTPEALAALEEHDWPGNVRELRNVAERLILTCAGRPITADDVRTRRATGVPSGQRSPAPRTPEAVAHACWQRMTEGESFWAAVYEPFMNRDLTRETLRLVIRSGLERTNGSHRLAAELFNVPAQEYRRFMNFLQKYECHLPLHDFELPAAALERSHAVPRREGVVPTAHSRRLYGGT